LAAPRRSPASVSADGKLAVYAESTYSFDTHSETNEICVLSIADGQTVTLTKDAKAIDPKWLGDSYEVVWLKEGDSGNTGFFVSDASAPGKSYKAGTVAGPVSNLKLYIIKSGMIGVGVCGQADPDGSLHNPKDPSKSHSSARLYDSLFVRYFDKYVTPQTSSIFTALLHKSQPDATGRTGQYSLVGFKNALLGTGLGCPIRSLDFDIGQRGLVFVAQDPKLNPANHTRSNAYFMSKEGHTDTSFQEPKKLEVKGLHGVASSPVFSPDGSAIALLQQKVDGYFSDKNRICVSRGLEYQKQISASELLQSDDGIGAWDLSPDSIIMWSIDGNSLFLQTQDTGCSCLFQLDLSQLDSTPKKLTSKGYIVDAVPAAAKTNRLFLSSTSLIDSSTCTILDPLSPPEAVVVSSKTQDGSLIGLSPSQVESLWWKGANNHPVHAWMIKPSFFEENQKYPLAYLIHGGPQGYWNDQWSIRWNSAIYAEQGYIVICPNPTGSAGYGQDFMDLIQNEWGGLPYEDLVRGFEYIESNLDYVDTNRAVALGASYGGYMVNWIQGHELGRKFKALVCHNGVFSMTSHLASDIQFFWAQSFGGEIWNRQEAYDKWDPSRFTMNWDTPHLVIHSELDYRLPVTEGLSAFNVLQMRGVESMFLNFPDENHFVNKHENSMVWHRVVLNFINSFVGLPTLLDGEGKNSLDLCIRGRQ
jgi:pre-mRNA-splicing helicase BRR2